ncbi:MAG: GNAT family N-acetyltransferase [Magnetovibrionaceae bacterium]
MTPIIANQIALTPGGAAPVRLFSQTTPEGRFEAMELSDVRTDPAFAADWNAFARSHGDVYYAIEYLEAEQHRQAGSVVLCRYNHSLGTVYRAVVLRPIPSVLGIQGAFDLLTPFEYSGPVVVAKEPGKRDHLIDASQTAFAAFCTHQGVVSEFTRFHPLLGTQQGWDKHYEIAQSCMNVALDLRPGPDRFFEGYSRSQRRNVRLARRHGVRIERCPLGRPEVATMQELYRDTLDRWGAPAVIDFPPRYLRRLGHVPEEWLSVYQAKDADGTPLSVLITLHGSRIGHSHILHTGNRGLGLKVNSLLYHEVAIDLFERGLEQLHFGGAARSQAGVYEFKCRFSQDRYAYAIGKKVYDRERYSALVKRASNLGADVNSGFFPAYRAGIG